MLICSACGKEIKDSKLTHCDECGGTVVIATVDENIGKAIKK